MIRGSHTRVCILEIDLCFCSFYLQTL